MSRRSLVVSKETMDGVNKREFKQLPVPPRAVSKGVGQKQTNTWTEEFIVDDIEISDDTNAKGTVIFQVRFKVADDSEFPDNVGMQHTEWYRVDYSDTVDEGRKIMSEISLGKLKAITKAAGEDPDLGLTDSGAWDPGLFFDSEDGTPPVLIGKKIYAKLRDKANTGEGPPRKVEVSRFLAPEEVASL